MTRADEADEARLAEIAGRLADGIEAALPGWVRRCVQARCESAGVALTDELDGATDAAASRCREQVAPAVRALLSADLDEQRSTPLTLLRAAVVHPTEVLERAGVPPVQRDEFEVRSFPADRYALAPASFADLDPDLAELGLVWGAAKAHVHLARRRLEGRR